MTLFWFMPFFTPKNAFFWKNWRINAFAFLRRSWVFLSDGHSLKSWGNGNLGISHSLFWEFWGNGKRNGEFERTLRILFLESLASRRGSLRQKITMFLGVQVSPKWAFFFRKSWWTKTPPLPPLRQREWPSLVFLEQTRILSGIQFTTHFRESFLWKRNDTSVVL